MAPAGIIGMFAFGATASTAQAEQLSSEHLYQPGDQVPTYVDPDGFLPDTSAPGSGFRAAAICVNVSDNDGKVTVSNDFVPEPFVNARFDGVENC